MNSNADLHLWIAIEVLTTALAALAGVFRAMRGTTLVAVWGWSVVAAVAIGPVQIVAAMNPAWLAGGRGDAIRFAAAAVAFCPVVALLGAKRPQDRAWQLIVFSFWVVLTLPAWQTLLLRPDRALVVHPIWSWFLVVLVIIGVSNYLPTRYALAALLAGAGQVFLVWHELPWAASRSGTLVLADDWLPATGLVLIAFGAILAAIRRPTRTASDEPLRRLWGDFRDCFGVVWGLRVAERVNATAAQNNSKLRLTWHGMESLAGASDQGTSVRDVEELRASLLALMGRFVSRAWIDKRIDGTD